MKRNKCNTEQMKWAGRQGR